MTALPGKGRLLTQAPTEATQEKNLPGKGRLLPTAEPQEDWGQWALRLGAQGASRVGEKIVGLPGDIKEGIGHGLINLYEKATTPDLSVRAPEADDSFKEIFKKTLPAFFSDANEKEKPKQREAPQWMKDALLGSGDSMKLPTSGDIRQFSEQATGGYTKPKNWMEEKYSQFISDFTDLTMVPAQFRMTPARRIGTALGSELLGDTAKAISGKESDKQKVKAGSMFLFSTLNPGGARQHVSNMYDRAEGMAQQLGPQDMRNTWANLHNLEHRVTQSGISTPEKTAMLTPLRELRTNIQNNQGRLTPNQLFQTKRDINRLRDRFYAETPTSTGRAAGRQYFRDLMTLVDDAIERSLRQNPQALEIFQNANQAWSTLHEAAHTGRFVSRLLPAGARNSAMGAIFQLATEHPTVVGKAFMGIAAGAGIVSGARVLTQVMNSPTLRRYYINTVRHAMAGNSKAALESWNQLNKAWEMEKENEKNKR